MLAILATLVLGSGVAALTDDLSDYRRIFPKPTGNNALEDYLHAVEILESPGAQPFAQWREYFLEMDLGISRTEPLPPIPLGLGPDSSLLDVLREDVRRHARVLSLIASGNRKPFFDPLSSRRLFPSTFYQQPLRDLAYFATTAAYVRFADGNSAAGTDILVQVFRMVLKASDGPPFQHYLSSISLGIGLRAADHHLRNLSAPDARRLAREVRDVRQRLAPPSQVVERELEEGYKIIRLLFDQNDRTPADDRLADEWPPQAPQWTAELQRTSPSARARLIRAMDLELETNIRSAKRLFEQPEREWTQPDRTTERDPTNAEEYAMNLGRSLGLTTMGYADVFVCSRAQLRLLEVTCLVVAYRWEHMRLPDKLADAAGADAIDPLTGEPYEMRVEPSGAFTLVSRGTPRSGEITLRTRGLPNFGGGSRPAPPLLLD